MEEPGRLQSMGSLRVGHDLVTLLWLFTFMHWRRKWQPTPVFLPGESQGRLTGCCLWGRRVGHDWSNLAAATFPIYRCFTLLANNMTAMTDTEAETLIFWPPDAKNWLIWKDPNAGKDWRQEEKGTIEDEMAGWYHQLDGHEFELAPGVGDRQRSLACYSPWGHKESSTTEWLNWILIIWQIEE